MSSPSLRPRADATDVLEPIRVILVDDDALARRAVRSVLEGDGMVVVAETGSGRESVELAAYHRPDVVLMDIVMPGFDGIAATRKIVARAPEVHVVMLTSGDDVDVAMATLRAGAAGYLSKELDADGLVRALRAVVMGQPAVPRRYVAALLDRVRSSPEHGVGLRPVRSDLTSREWEVVDLLCQNRSTREIARELVLSSETVRSHVKSILRKLGVRSRAEAVIAAERLRSEAGTRSRET